ncbi:CAF1-domain-containing protein [Backusella circina FSU 941]|nr:CAF1-domain-containing protein [Backusella circina FSU 941]
MEIPRQSFVQKLRVVEKAIKECDFMAIDTELSGLHRPPKPIRIYTMADRYIEYKEATERFIIIQFGLCTFTWDQPSGRYIAKPFNFYVFPTGATGKIQANRVFMTQAQAFDFLVKQSFDFNKWVYQGVPYLTKQEEAFYLEEARKRMNDDMPDIPIDDKEASFMDRARASIDEWISADTPADPEGINIMTRNAYQRRLIYQDVRSRYKDLTAIGMSGFIRVVRLTEKQAKEREREAKEKIEKDLATAVGFRKVIDMISESKKIIVGHNMLLDVCHVIGQFIQPLPDTLPEFKKLAHSIFPRMVDTKFIVSQEPGFKELFGTGTALEALRFETSREAFYNPRIDMHPEFPRYLTEMAHEAGYDAFMTGAVFLKLVSAMDKKANPSKFEPKEEENEEEKKPAKRVTEDGWEISEEEDDADNENWAKNDEEDVYNYGSIRVDLTDTVAQSNPLLKPFLNKSVLVRTAYDFLDFCQPETITNQSNTFYVSYKGELPEGKKSELFSKYGKYIEENVDEQSFFVTFERLNVKPTELKLQSEDITILPVAEYLK